MAELTQEELEAQEALKRKEEEGGGEPEGGEAAESDTEGENSEGGEPIGDEGGEYDDRPSYHNDPDYADYIDGGGNSGDDGEFKKVPVEEYNKLVEAANNWRAFEANEVALAVVAHVNAGKPIEELVAEFDTRDYSSMSEEDLFLLDVRSTPGITEEEIEEALDEFKSMPAYKRKKMAAEVREQFSSRKGKGGSGLVAAKRNMEEAHTKRIERFEADFNNELNKWKTKKVYFDVPITDAEVKELRQLVFQEGGLTFLDKDGNYDAKKAFKAAFALKYTHKLAEAKQKKGARKAQESYIREHQNAGADPNRAGGEVPSNIEKKVLDENAAARAEYQKLVKQYGNKKTN